jgi:hypothetical protein
MGCHLGMTAVDRYYLSSTVPSTRAAPERCSFYPAALTVPAEAAEVEHMGRTKTAAVAAQKRPKRKEQPQGQKPE